MPGSRAVVAGVTERHRPTAASLYVMQTTGVDPMTPLGQFADELSKWERPNRIAKLGALHARAVQRIGLAVLTGKPPPDGSSKRSVCLTAVTKHYWTKPGTTERRHRGGLDAVNVRWGASGDCGRSGGRLQMAVCRRAYPSSPAALTSTVSDEPPRGSAPPVPSVTERSTEQRRPAARSALRTERSRVRSLSHRLSKRRRSSIAPRNFWVNRISPTRIYNRACPRYAAR